MSSTDNAAGVARCNNRADCSKAAAGEALDWYSGAGEYCPECGEVLTRETPPPAASLSARSNAAPAPPSPPASAAAGSGAHARNATATSVRAEKVSAPASRTKSDAKSAAASPARGNGAAVASPRPTVPPRPTAPAPSAAVRPPPVPPPAAPAPPPRPNGAAAPSGLRPARRPKFILPLRWFWVIAAALIASAAIVFAARPNVAMNRAPADADKVTVCPVSSATQLAVDLVHGYVEKSSIQANRFVLGDAKTCDVSFSMTPETPDDVIAHDAIVAIVNPLNPISRISESQLRGIFSGSIRDWSALGMRPGAIVPMLPDAETDEAKALATSLLFGVAVDQGVRRDRSSAAVARSISTNG